MPQISYGQLEQYFSQPRLEPYLRVSAGKKGKAKKLYKANLLVAQAFHPLLSVLEVALRNGLNQVLASYFSDPEWIINQQSGFMSDASLRPGRFFLREQVSKAVSHLNRKGLAVTSGKIIAEQSFGFWTELFERHHYRLVGGRPIQAFKHLPPGVNRDVALRYLNEIRRFRNRISHNEPLCFKAGRLDFTRAEDAHRSIVGALAWLEPKLADWAKDLDKVRQEIHNAQHI